MDCIFKITNAVKKIGFVILLAELAVIAAPEDPLSPRGALHTADL